MSGTNWTDTWDQGFCSIGGKVTLFDSFASVWKLKQAAFQREQAELGVREMERGMGVQVRRLVDAARTQCRLRRGERARRSWPRSRPTSAVSRENEMITRTEERGARITEAAG